MSRIASVESNSEKKLNSVFRETDFRNERLKSFSNKSLEVALLALVELFSGRKKSLPNPSLHKVEFCVEFKKS